MPHPSNQNRKKKTTDIVFRFANARLANHFLAYMSDGGGEYRFLDGPDVKDVRFEYHTANDGKFGPIVDVTGEVVDDDHTSEPCPTTSKNEKTMKTKGLHTYRLKDNPEEERFAKAWDEHNRHGTVLAHLLDTRSVQTGRPVDPTDRDEAVAATVVQWLGSPVGQGFLSDLGYTRK